MVGKDGEDVQELLHEHPPFLIGRLRPDLVDVQLAEDAENVVEVAGDVRVASGFLLSPLVLVAEGSDLVREPFLFVSEQLRVDLSGVVEVQELPALVRQIGKRALYSSTARGRCRPAGCTGQLPTDSLLELLVIRQEPQTEQSGPLEAVRRA